MLAWFKARAKLSGVAWPSPALRTGVGGLPTMAAAELMPEPTTVLVDMVCSLARAGGVGIVDGVDVGVAAPHLLQCRFIGAPLFEP